MAGRATASLLLDRRGAVAAMAAICCVPLFGIGALVLDLGLAFTQQTSLRAATDAAALAAVLKTASAPSVATSSLASNNWPAATLISATTGIYCPDPAVAVSSRFAAGATTCTQDQYTKNIAGTNAVKVVTVSNSPVGLGRLLAGSNTLAIGASATATQINMAGFSAGTGLAGVSNGVINQVLGGLTGTSLNLSAVSYNGLANANIDALSFLQALAVNAGVSAGTYSSLANTNVTVGQIMSAAVTALNSPNSTSNSAAASALATLAAALPSSTTIPVNQLVNLQPYLNDQVTAPGPAALQGGINAYGLISAVSQIIGSGTNLGNIPTGSQPETFTAALGNTSSVTVNGIIVQPPATPAFGFGPVGTTVSESQVSLYVTINLTPTNLASAVSTALGAAATASLSIPLYIQLAGGTATLTGIACTPGTPPTQTVTIAGTTVVQQVALANHGAIATPANPATLLTVSTPLLGNVITLKGSSSVITQNATPQTVTFTNSATVHQIDTSPPTVMTIDGDASLLGSTASSLGSTTLTATVLPGLGLLSGTVSTLASTLIPLTQSDISAALAIADAPVDAAVNGVLAALGLRLGYMDITATSVRCGVPVLVQ